MAITPPWLKAMENGGLGEARARAFLMERFWVLERSVDINGADFLIQRRLTSRNFLDREPPRLGVVQVKFVQDGNTSISLHKSYVCNSEDKPFTEFFLLIFSGKEDRDKTFLLSANDIVREFSERTDGDHKVLTISSSRLLENTNYSVFSKARALDQIDLALKNADFMANRMFLSTSSYVSLDAGQIDPELTLPLYNCYGNLTEAFFEEKQKLQRTVYDMEEVLEAMQTMLRSTDPLSTFSLYKSVVRQHVVNRNVTFDADFFTDDSFLSGIKEHKARVERLRELGLTGAYIALMQEYENSVFQRLLEIGKREGLVYVVATYQPGTYLYPKVEVIDAESSNWINNVMAPGHVTLQLNLGSVFWKGPYEKYEADQSKILKKRIHSLVGQFQLAIDPFVFGQEFLNNLY